MNSINPFESPSTTANPSGWQPLDFFVAGLWLSIPVCVFFARLLIVPIFADFGMALPWATRFVILRSTLLALGFGAAFFILALLYLPQGRARRAVAQFGCILGNIIAAFCLIAFLVPLFMLWQNLR